MNNLAVIYILVVAILPLIAMCIYALIRRSNRYLIVCPLLMSVIYFINFGCFVQTQGRGVGIYFLGLFIAMLVGAVGLYYGYARHVPYIAEEKRQLGAVSCFLVCFCIVLFPFVPAYFYGRAIKNAHATTERVKLAHPDLGARPSWDKVVGEIKEEKEERGE